jgi:hypothetical protein
MSGAAQRWSCLSGLLLAVLLASADCSRKRPCEPSFMPPVAYSVAGNPSSIATGDFNGDGHLDLAVANWAGGVSLLLGNGDGTFRPMQIIAGTGPWGPRSVATSDFNGDGQPDLAIGNQSSGGLGSDNTTILFGQGHGTFARASVLDAGTGYFVLAADFNSDGHPDLAIANGNFETDTTHVPSWGTVQVLLGDGDGGFGPASSYTTGAQPSSMVAADFHNDGRLDLAVACAFSGGVSLLRGNGDGTFQGASAAHLGGGYTSIATGDFNSDGRPDLVVANNAVPNGDGGVSLWLGKGDGTFEPGPVLDAGPHPESSAVEDFNGDGHKDLAVPNGVAAHDISVFLGNGDGSFQAPLLLDAGEWPIFITTGDFNEDGRADIAVANTISNDVSILLNNDCTP